MNTFLFGSDPFVYNLRDLLERNECLTTTYGYGHGTKTLSTAIKRAKPKLLVFLSGNGSKDTETAKSLIAEYVGTIPIFAVGTGMHYLIEAFGGTIGRASVGLHGKAVTVSHDDQTIFKKIDNNFVAGRYNTLTPADVPYDLEVSCRDEHQVIMAIRRKEAFAEGVQFHPESILTPCGNDLIRNVIREARKR